MWVPASNQEAVNTGALKRLNGTSNLWARQKHQSDCAISRTALVVLVEHPKGTSENRPCLTPACLLPGSDSTEAICFVHRCASTTHQLRQLLQSHTALLAAKDATCSSLSISSSQLAKLDCCIIAAVQCPMSNVQAPNRSRWHESEWILNGTKSTSPVPMQ